MKHFPYSSPRPHTGSRDQSAYWLGLAAVAIASLATACSSKPETPTPDGGAIVDAGKPDAQTPDAATPDVGNDGVLSIAALQAPVTATYDENGVLHLSCKSDRDCFVAQGFFHARDRFFQMDLIRNQTRGRLSEMVGFLTGKSGDLFYRKVMTTREGDPLEDAYVDAMNDETKDAFQAYADGVNAWLEDVRADPEGAKLSKEYRSENLLYEPAKIRDWEPQDSVSVMLQLSYQFSGFWYDLGAGDAAAVMEPEPWADLFNGRPSVVSSVVPQSQMTNALRTLPGTPKDPEALRRRLAPARDVLKDARADVFANPSLLFGPPTPGQGSNNWAVGPGLSASGNPLLANDPHLGMTNPSIWYLMEMDAKSNGDGSIHASGASIPAGPGIILGHNENIAWGGTVAMLDLADVYVETLTADGNGVMRDGQRVELIKKTYEFNGRYDDTVSQEFEWVPGHGPLLRKDVEAGTAVSLKWSAHEPGPDLNYLLDLLRAKTVEEADVALDVVRSVNINWVVADTQGNIGWFPKGQVPDRTPWASMDVPYWAPLPGDGSAEWNGDVDKSLIPTLYNPPAEFIATSNNDFDGSWTDGDPTNDGHPPLQVMLPAGPGLRHTRIVERIGASSAHTPETMSALQTDSKSLHGERLVPEILETAAALDPTLSASAKAMVTALQGWQKFECPTGLDGHDPENSPPHADAEVRAEAVGCAAFHVLLPHLTREIFADELAPTAGTWSAWSEWHEWQNQLLFVFADPASMVYGEAFFDDSTTPALETREDNVSAALDLAGKWLEENIGSGDPSDWLWGRIHAARFASMLGISAFENGPFASTGGYQTVEMADPLRKEDMTFEHVNGGSFRFVYELDPEGVRAWYQFPGGNVHLRDSPFYGNLIEKWLNHEDSELRFGADNQSPPAETVVLETAAE